MTISAHARQRYSERIMGKSDPLDVNLYIQTHGTKIEEDIAKMIEYGELIYTGKPVADTKNNNKTNVYLKDLWVVITDNTNGNVITLYKIDFGLDDEFNKQFVSKMKEKLAKANAEFNAACEKVDDECAGYRDIIADNESLIRTYEGYIKNLKTLNEDYEKTIKDLQLTKNIKEEEIRAIIGGLIGKKTF